MEFATISAFPFTQKADLAIPLTEAARDLLNRELRAGVDDGKLVDLVMALYEEDRLCIPLEEAEKGDLSTVAMAGRARAAFDVERVTKAFYRDYDTHRKAFLKFTVGVLRFDGWIGAIAMKREFPCKPHPTVSTRRCGNIVRAPSFTLPVRASITRT